jgi:2'-5' RNA ligase
VPITIDGVGHFVGRDGAITLWAGVTPSVELSALHERVAVSLQSIGYQPEDRGFTPHISLARCDPTVSADYINAFLSAGAALFERATIDTIELFASTFVNDIPRYRLVTSFANAGD